MGRGIEQAKSRTRRTPLARHLTHSREAVLRIPVPRPLWVGYVAVRTDEAGVEYADMATFSRTRETTENLAYRAVKPTRRVKDTSQPCRIAAVTLEETR